MWNEDERKTVRFIGFLIIGVGTIAALLFLADLGRQSSNMPSGISPPAPTAKNTPPVGEPAAVTNDTDTTPIKPAQGELVTLPPVRDVTPKSMTQGPQVTGLTIRLPGPPPPVPKPRKRRFFRVIVADAGTIKAKKVTIKLAGVTTPNIKKVCTDAKKRKWRCGLAARGALRMLIRVRAIECPTMPFEPPVTITARCTVGRTDLAEWLVTQGWAEPAEADDALHAALEDAKSKKRGMWR